MERHEGECHFWVSFKNGFLLYIFFSKKSTNPAFLLRENEDILTHTQKKSNCKMKKLYQNTSIVVLTKSCHLV